MLAMRGEFCCGMATPTVLGMGLKDDHLCVVPILSRRRRGQGRDACAGMRIVCSWPVWVRGGHPLLQYRGLVLSLV